MIQLTNTTTQTIPVGGTVTFDKVVSKTGCAECFNSLVPNSVKMKAQGGTYDITFGGNIANETANLPIQIAIAIGGTAIPYTARSAQPAAAGDLWGVNTFVSYKNCCCDLDRITIVNVGPNPLVLAPNALLRVSRRA